MHSSPTLVTSSSSQRSSAHSLRTQTRPLRIPRFGGTRWSRSNRHFIAQVCIAIHPWRYALTAKGRIFVVLLLHLGAKLSTTKEYTTSALFKWASMISMGKQATFLQVPAEVAARAHDSVWSDSEQAPSSRAKKSSAKKIEIIHPSPAQQAILGRPPPAASAASGLSSCAPGTLWEAGFAPQAILPAQDIGDACHSDWCAAPLVVPVAKVSQVYELLRDEAQSAVQDMEGDLQWCNVPV